MFKYKLGQTVWFIKDSKIHSAPVGARTLCEVDGAFKNTREGGSWNARILYGTVFGNWAESQLFATFDDLVSYLKTTAVVG